MFDGIRLHISGINLQKNLNRATTFPERCIQRCPQKYRPFLKNAALVTSIAAGVGAICYPSIIRSPLLLGLSAISGLTAYKASPYQQLMAIFRQVAATRFIYDDATKYRSYYGQKLQALWNAHQTELKPHQNTFKILIAHMNGSSLVRLIFQELVEHFDTLEKTIIKNEKWIELILPVEMAIRKKECAIKQTKEMENIRRIMHSRPKPTDPKAIKDPNNAAYFAGQISNRLQKRKMNCKMAANLYKALQPNLQKPIEFSDVQFKAAMNSIKKFLEKNWNTKLDGPKPAFIISQNTATSGKVAPRVTITVKA